MALMRQLQNARTGQVLVLHLEIADTIWKSTVGLIGRARLAPDAGLWLASCNAIHTFGLRFAIDVLFVDGQGVVLRVVSDVRPCRICGPMWRAKTVVELPAGAAARNHILPGAHVALVAV